jgi:RNA polymerase sigma-70 factor (ECF subfamily)
VRPGADEAVVSTARGSAADDPEIVGRMAGGDSSALAELYDRHGRAIYSLACRILSDPADAEDIVQDVFSQAWRQAARYDRSRAAVAGWLLMMTRTRSLDRLRARNARPAVSAAGEPDFDTFPDQGPGPEAATLTADAVRRLRQAMGELSEPQRRAIELAYFEGLTQADIAGRLDEPLGTVKTRLRSALLKLRAAMVRE